MGKIYGYKGNQYRMVNREAEVGDKILVVNAGRYTGGTYRNGDVLVVTGTNGGTGVFCDEISNHDNFGGQVDDEEYCVLEPLASEEVTVDTELALVEGTQASDQVIEMLANLARRVTSLERQLADTQRNLERQAEEHESLKKGVGFIEDLALSNQKDIAMLNERTGEYDKASKSGAKLLAEAFDALARYERSVGR